MAKEADSPREDRLQQRLAAVDERQEARAVPAGAVSPTHVTDDDIFIQYNARFQPLQEQE